jgi:hypothetical protein
MYTAARWCSLLAAGALAAQANAQRLNLDGPEAPDAGSSLIALEITQSMTNQAERLDPQAWHNDPDRQALEATKREIRLAAAALAQIGNNAGTNGSHLVLTAMTIDRRLEELDDILSQSDDRAMLLALAADLETLRNDWNRGERIAPDQLDRDLRFAFAQLSMHAQGRINSIGWAVLGSNLAESSLQDILVPLAESGVGDIDLAKLSELGDRLDQMNQWPGFARESTTRRSLIVQAAEAISNYPVWLPAATRKRLADDFAAAMDTKDPADRDAELMLLIAQGRVIDQLTEMGTGRQADRLRSRAANALAERSTDASGSLSATELAVETLDTSALLSDIQRDDSLLRQIRIAWRSLIPDVRNVNVNARDAAVNLLVDPTNITNPGELSAIAALRTLADDFAILRRFSDRFAPGTETEDKANTAIAERLLALGQDMDDEELRPLSLELFRELNDQLDLWEEIRSLRDSADRVIGDRRDDLTLRLQNLNNQWLAGWGTLGGRGAGQGVAEDLKITRDVLRTLADVNAFTDLATLNSWPGFEMSQASRRLVTSNLTGEVDGLVSELIRGPSEISRRRTFSTMTSLRGTHGPALLTGRLARLATQEGLTLAGPIAELGFGPPVRDSWMAVHRDAIADVCWYTAELSRQNANDPDESETRTQELRAHLKWRALRTLEAIERASD